jgi:hypothetical protein
MKMYGRVEGPRILLPPPQPKREIFTPGHIHLRAGTHLPPLREFFPLPNQIVKFAPLDAFI